MKSIKRRFDAIKAKNPLIGDVCVLAEAIFGQKVSRDRLGRHFKALINKDEYLEQEKRGIIAWLYGESWSEAYVKKGQKGPKRRAKMKNRSNPHKH